MNKVKNLFGTIGILLLLVLFLYLTTRPSIIAFLGLKDLNEAADSINGLTAPIIGIVGAFLVYISFKAQVNANKIQFTAINEQRDLELLYKFYEELKIDLQRMQSEYGPKYGQHAILDSFMNYVSDDKHKENPYPEFHLYLIYIFNQFRFLSNRIKRNTTLNESEKVYIIDKVKFLFDLYFKQYHIKLTKELYTNDYSKEIKNALEGVYTHMQELNSIHSEFKDKLRSGAN